MNEQRPSKDQSIVAALLRRLDGGRSYETTISTATLNRGADEIERLAQECVNWKQLHDANEACVADLLRQLREAKESKAAHAEGADWCCPHYKPRGKGCAECSAGEPWEAPGCDCPGIRKRDPSAHAPNCPYQVIKEIHGAAQPPGDDTRRIDALEEWLAKSKAKGFSWDSRCFDTDKTVREQIDRRLGLTPTKEGG